MQDNPPAASSVPRPKASPRIVVACLAAVALFIGPVAMLYWTWLPRQSPSTMIVVQGDEHFIGAQVVVESVLQSAPPLAGILTAEDGYRIRMHVPPGVYEVSVKIKGVVVIRRRAEPALAGPAFMRLSEGHPASAPYAPPNAGRKQPG